MKESNNKGMTLIELVVIIAIMAVLTASFAVSLTLISRQRVSNAANSLKSTLQLAQTYAKSRGECYVTIEGTENGSDTYIWIEDDDGNPQIGNGPNNINKKITTKVVFEDGTTTTLVDGMIVEIHIDRSTGGFKGSKLYGTTESGTVLSKDDAIEKGPVIQVIFSNGEKETTLWLATNTGLVTFDSQKD